MWTETERQRVREESEVSEKDNETEYKSYTSQAVAALSLPKLDTSPEQNAPHPAVHTGGKNKQTNHSNNNNNNKGGRGKNKNKTTQNKDHTVTAEGQSGTLSKTSVPERIRQRYTGCC